MNAKVFVVFCIVNLGFVFFNLAVGTTFSLCVSGFNAFVATLCAFVWGYEWGAQ